jgi:hypothetical protein
MQGAADQQGSGGNATMSNEDTGTIENSTFINVGTMALALCGLSLATGQKAFFFLFAAAGLTAYAIVLVRTLKKRRSAKSDLSKKDP